MQVHAFIFQRPPQALDHTIVDPAPLAVHADLDLYALWGLIFGKAGRISVELTLQDICSLSNSAGNLRLDLGGMIGAMSRSSKSLRDQQVPSGHIMKQTCGLTQVMGLTRHQAEVDEVTERICEHEILVALRENVQWPGTKSPFYLGSSGASMVPSIMAYSRSESHEHMMENIRFDPSAEPLEHAIPFARLIR